MMMMMMKMMMVMMMMRRRRRRRRTVTATTTFQDEKLLKTIYDSLNPPQKMYALNPKPIISSGHGTPFCRFLPSGVCADVGGNRAKPRGGVAVRDVYRRV